MDAGRQSRGVEAGQRFHGRSCDRGRHMRVDRFERGESDLWKALLMVKILLPAFAQIQTMVAAPPVYTPSTAVSLSTWRYPTGALADHHDRLDCSNHLAPRSIDASISAGPAMMQTNETGWPHHFVRSHSPHSNRPHRGHTRQRSASAPGRYDTDGFGVAAQLQQHHDGETHRETLGARCVDLESSYEDSGAER